jgi:VWFA-related protein
MEREAVVTRLNPQRTAFIACTIILGTCGAGEQTRPLLGPSVAQKPSASLSGSGPVVREGLFTIDVVVTDAAGNPVSDLAAGDFTLLDNGQPAKIRTLHNSLDASEPAPELIFVLDTVNISGLKLAQTESAIVHFLRRNSGRLEERCFLYRLTRDGLFSSSELTQDGNLLAKEVEQQKSPRTVWRAGWAAERAGPAGSWAIKLNANSLSISALGSIAIDQRETAGRKVLIWIGPGWPVQGTADSDFDDITELSTRLREARITLENLTMGPSPDQSFDYHDYLGAPRSRKDMQPTKLLLQVIATHTGGLVLDSLDIAGSVKEERSFYTLTFNPPHTYQMDEYRDLRVQVARPAMTVRAPTGYYNEPVYFDNSRPGIEKVTVAQLEELVHAQTDLLRNLTNLELTERLSTPRLDALLSVIHGERERQALTVDADLSLALAPPAGEIVNRLPPTVEDQRAILGRTFDYLQHALPKLPDFYAFRSTVRFEEPAAHDSDIWKLPHRDQTLHFAAGEHATVLYRNGHEVVEKTKKLGKRPVVRGMRARNLETTGTFGPILAYVLTAAATSPSTLSWKRWERSKYGDLAVFSYRASRTSLLPEISYCCLPEGNGTTFYKNRPDTYGEFAVNPDTGAVMRIVIIADLDEERDPDVPLIRSQMMVEYGPEDLGGKTYICPQRSIGISRGRTERELNEWGMVFSLYSYFDTMVNDMTFGGYHKFGGVARMLPGFEETQ